MQQNKTKCNKTKLINTTKYTIKYVNRYIKDSYTRR